LTPLATGPGPVSCASQVQRNENDTSAAQEAVGSPTLVSL